MDLTHVKSLLKGVLNIYSVSGSEGELAKYLHGVLSSSGIDSWIDQAGNVIGVKGRGPRVLWLHAHMDTVPGFIEVREEGELVYGRGAVDDKGPLVSMLAAFMELDPDVKLVLTLVTDEEGDSKGSLTLIEEDLPKPDGIIVGEPTGMHIAYAYRGSARVRILCRGEGGHAAGPNALNNPILKAYDAYNGLVARLGNGQSSSTYTIVPTVIRCGDHPAKVPEECLMIVNVRIPVNSSCVELKNAVNDLQCVYIDDCLDPIVADVNNPVIRALVRASILNGIKPTLSRKLGTSDMAILARLTKNLAAYGPGDPSLSHGPVEYININEVVKASEVIKTAVVEFGKLIKAHNNTPS